MPPDGTKVRFHFPCTRPTPFRRSRVMIGEIFVVVDLGFLTLFLWFDTFTLGIQGKCRCLGNHNNPIPIMGRGNRFVWMQPICLVLRGHADNLISG